MPTAQQQLPESFTESCRSLENEYRSLLHFRLHLDLGTLTDLIRLRQKKWKEMSLDQCEVQFHLRMFVLLAPLCGFRLFNEQDW